MLRRSQQLRVASAAAHHPTGRSRSPKCFEGALQRQHLPTQAFGLRAQISPDQYSRIDGEPASHDRQERDVSRLHISMVCQPSHR